MDARHIRSDFSNAKFDANWSLNFTVGGAHAEKPEKGKLVSYRHRAPILDEGDASTSVYEVIEGGVILFKLLPDGRRQIIEVLGVGDVFGLSSTDVCDVAAEALTAVRVVVYDRRTIDSEASLRDRLFARVRKQMCALHDHALLLGRKSAQERVATFIIRLVPGRGGFACAGPAKDERDTRVDLAMTRQEIADYLGLTIETVSRAFSTLRRQGVIAYVKQDRVQIADVCRLCHLTGSH